VILIWSNNWAHVYRYWPTTYNTMVFESDLLLVPARTARERLAHEMAAVTYKEFALQDANTLEATQSMLESRVVEQYPLNDQEITCRHFHKTAGAWVDAYRHERAAPPR
jgi:glycine betaine catabolism A